MVHRPPAKIVQTAKKPRKKFLWHARTALANASGKTALAATMSLLTMHHTGRKSDVLKMLREKKTTWKLKLPSTTHHLLKRKPSQGNKIYHRPPASISKFLPKGKGQEMETGNKEAP